MGSFLNRSDRRAKEDLRIKKVRDAIDENPALGAGDLARKVNLSRSRLDELFKHYASVGLGDFVRQRRLVIGAQLLEATDSRIKEIADSVGYEHASSFARAFKQFFGISPSEYRRRRL
jgi:AraC-like DNA-binding protein